MNLSIREWLAERQLQINHMKSFTCEQLAGITYRIVKDMELKSLIPFDICTLAEVLELPLGVVEEEISVMAGLTEHLLRSLSQKKALKRNEGTWLAFQIAYLLALERILHQEQNLQRPWLHRARIPTSVANILSDSQLQGILKTLSPGKLTDTQAEQALGFVADSLLVQQINQAIVAWFVANGVEEFVAKLLTKRLEHALPGHLLQVIAQNPTPLAQLQKFFRLGSWGDISAIDLYRENYRASLLQTLGTPLLMEYFALRDIYVPLVGVPQAASIKQPMDLKIWVEQQLNDLETIAVIESELGGGKTSFCQIWAAEAARNLYPDWIPIMIRLRDIQYGRTFIETLSSGLALNTHTNLESWLEAANPRCVLLLDGLDELPPIHSGNRAKTIFLQQLLQFQSERRHKIILTGDSATVQTITAEMPQKWQRITIQPLEVNELKQWFQQWALIQSLPIAQNLFTFLKEAGLFTTKSSLPEISLLVRKPLILYLLAILHRDGLLDNQIFQKNLKYALIWEIGSRLRQWLLGYPLTKGIKTMLLRSGACHIHRTPEAISSLLANCQPQNVIAQIQAIALLILHSDRHQVTLTEALNLNTLPAFYFRCLVSDNSPAITHKVEFSHPTLGYYLCADAVAQQLQVLTQRQQDIYGTAIFTLDTPDSIAQHLYHLLGYGILPQEIEELVIPALQTHQLPDFSWQILRQRLESFWRAWYQGRWLDTGIAHQVLPYFHRLENPINIEQININVGVNIFLLLVAISRQTAIPFRPCGDSTNPIEFYPQAMGLLLTKASMWANHPLTTRICSQSLAKINLSGAILSQVGLIGANLTQADLSYSVLVNANLTGANLTGANLTSANLTGANLTGVNLETVNLTNACLCDAIFLESDREIAKLQGALFSLQQFQAVNSLLSQQPHFEVSNNWEQTSIWEQNHPNVGLIETLEGELIMSTILDNSTNDETIFDS